jgi:hypothetical protein
LLRCRAYLDFPVVVGSHLWQVDRTNRQNIYTQNVKLFR